MAAVKLPISPENEVKQDVQEPKETTKVASVDSMPVNEAVEATAVSITSSNSNASTTGCSNCFGGKKCKRWVGASGDKNTPEMSEVYCPTCDDAANETPACLNKMPDKKSKPKHKTILSVESELIVSKRGSLRLTGGTQKQRTVVRSASLSAADRKPKCTLSLAADKKDKAKMKEKDKVKEKDKDKDKDKCKTTNLLAKVSPKRIRSKTGTATTTKTKNNNSSKDPKDTKTVKECNSNNNSMTEQETPTQQLEEYEIADDATSLNGSSAEASEAKMAILSEQDTKLMINVRGREELPVVEQRSPPNTAELNAPSSAGSGQTNPYSFEKCVRVPAKSECHPLQQQQQSQQSMSQELHGVAAAVETFDNKRDNSISPTTSATTTTSRAIKTTKLQLDTQSATAAAAKNDISDCNGNCQMLSSPPPPSSAQPSSSAQRSPISPPPSVSAASGSGENGSVSDGGGAGSGGDNSHANATLPRAKRSAAQHAFYQRALSLVPKRRTPDGTNIYYWCDLPRKALKGVLLRFDFPFADQ